VKCEFSLSFSFVFAINGEVENFLLKLFQNSDNEHEVMVQLGTFDLERSFDKSEIKKHNFYHTDKFDLLSNTSKILQGNHYILPANEQIDNSHSMMNFIYSSTK
jgi:hypothetical protein